MDSRGGGASDNPLRNYRIGKTLGHGSFGKVKIAEHLLTGHKVAIKILNRRKMRSPDMEEKLRRETKICRLFVHPHVIRLYEVIETPTDIFVVMEYVKSGELFDYIVEKGRLQEDEARSFFQQIIAGVEYCHRNRVVHRDLKPENLLLDSRGNVKIADFGLSNIMRDGHFLKTSCGSPNYAAPEVVSGKLYAGPEGGLYTLPSHLSAGARDLIPRMLVVDPLKRITIPQIRQHHWFKAHLPRYLAVPPPDAMQHLKKACSLIHDLLVSIILIDEEILQEVIRKGFDRGQLLASLQNREQNDATVAYHLLYDSRSIVSGGYLGAEFEDSMEPFSPGLFSNIDSQMSVGHGLSYEISSRPLSSREKKWLVGLQSPATPQEIMTQVLGALQELNVRWKKIGHYNMKCMWCYSHNPIHTTTNNCMSDDCITVSQTAANGNGLLCHLRIPNTSNTIAANPIAKPTEAAILIPLDLGIKPPYSTAEEKTPSKLPSELLILRTSKPLSSHVLPNVSFLGLRIGPPTLTLCTTSNACSGKPSKSPTGETAAAESGTRSSGAETTSRALMKATESFKGENFSVNFVELMLTRYSLNTAISPPLLPFTENS
nr:SNF1-related protein kinase catalytic subunit alpha KIN10-like [Ipomoea batatas]